MDDLVPSQRKYPFIEFKAKRDSGKSILFIEDLSKVGRKVLPLKTSILTSFKKDKILLLGDPLKVSLIMDMINGKVTQDSGSINVGQTVTQAYIPRDNREYFESDESIIEWLSNYSDIDDQQYIRGFLGRMLFSGEEPLKEVKVLSGGEKARCMFSKAMLEQPNLLLLDDPTNHLDLESIQALNNALKDYQGEMIFASSDHQFVNSIANRIIEIKEDNTIVDRRCTYDEYLDREYGIQR